MLTYTKAATLFAKARDKDKGAALERHTRLVQTGEGDFAVKYHATPVVTIHKDCTYTLKTGGWRTATTKKRINDYSPARVYQRKGEWLLCPGASGEVVFMDGVRVSSNSYVMEAHHG